MQVQEIMHPDVQIVDPNMTIRDAARRMRANDVGALPVGENDRLIGMVTDRDIVVRAVAEDRSPGDTTVREVSPKASATVSSTTTSRRWHELWRDIRSDDFLSSTVASDSSDS
jgi:CBS domain-containing protein